MTAIASDEIQDLKVGDLIYRYLETQVFACYVESDVAPPPGKKKTVEMESEFIHVTAVAEILPSAFVVWWALDTISAERCVETGLRIKNEIIARLLFPNLGDYAFVSGK